MAVRQATICKGCWGQMRMPVPLRGIASAPFRAFGAGASVMNGGVSAELFNSILSALGGVPVTAPTAGTVNLVNHSGATIDGPATNLGVAVNIVNQGVWSNAGGSTITNFNNSGVLSLGAAGGAPATLTAAGNAVFGVNSLYVARITAARRQRPDHRRRRGDDQRRNGAGAGRERNLYAGDEIYPGYGAGRHHGNLRVSGFWFEPGIFDADAVL